MNAGQETCSPYFISWALAARVWAPISLQETQGRGNLPRHPPLHTSSWLRSSSCLNTALSSELYLKVGDLVRQHCGWTRAQCKCRLALNQHAKMGSVWGRAVALPSAVLQPGSSHIQQTLVWMLEVEAQRIVNQQPWLAEVDPSARITTTSHFMQMK